MTDDSPLVSVLDSNGTDPFPDVTCQRITAPAKARPDASPTCTTKGAGSARPAVPCCLSPETMERPGVREPPPTRSASWVQPTRTPPVTEATTRSDEREAMPQALLRGRHGPAP